MFLSEESSQFFSQYIPQIKFLKNRKLKKSLVEPVSREIVRSS